MKVMAGNPFPAGMAARTYFSLLAAPPDAHLADALARLDFSPDGVRIVGDAIYTLYATKLSDSKFNNNFFERKLGVAATTRNFNTLSRCLALRAPPCGPNGEDGQDLGG